MELNFIKNISAKNKIQELDYNHIKRQLKTFETQNEKPKDEHKQIKGGEKLIENEFEQNMNSFDLRIKKLQREYSIFLENSIEATKQTLFDIGLL